MWVGVIQKSRGAPVRASAGETAARLAIFNSCNRGFYARGGDASYSSRSLWRLTAYPAVGIALAIWLVLVIAVAIHQRWRGHPF